MSGKALSTLSAHSIPLTPKQDKQGVKIKLKVFWKTTKFWTPSNVLDFQKEVPFIAERLRTEQYWNKDGDICLNKFTCEDFAIRVLCEYAAAKELPVKLTTGVRTYRNMERYSADEHDEYASNMYGFSEMVMPTYGARDMQLSNNTIAISTADELLPGDILAQAKDRRGQMLSLSQKNVAHHIQMLVQKSASSIGIYQGNSDATIHRPMTWLNKLAFRDPAKPQNSAYGGMKVERGMYTKNVAQWDYKNFDTGNKEKDLLSQFLFYRWNFDEFNK